MKKVAQTIQLTVIILIIVFCCILTCTMAWTAYSTITDRPGYIGSKYLFYDLTKVQYFIYCAITAFLACYFSFIMLKKGFKRDKSILKRPLLYFIIFLITFIISDLILDLRFHHKV